MSREVVLHSGGKSVGGHLIDVDVLGHPTGWDTVDIKRRQSATVWKGQPARTYELPLRLDGMGRTIARDESIRADLKRLQEWARFSHKKVKGKAVVVEPPTITVTGAPHAPKGVKWVISDLQMGAYILNEHGKLVQQDVTVELLEYHKKPKSPAAQANKKK